MNCFAKSISLNDLPQLPKDTYLFAVERTFGHRGKIGGYVLPPCRIGTYFDKKIFYAGEKVEGFEYAGEKLDSQSMRIMYEMCGGGSFCGAYTILMADISEYKTMTFLVKGERGGESFEIGMNDVISNKREDAVFVGSVNKYLRNGVTTEWQAVNIPLSDFYGPNLSKVYSIIFNFNDIGAGEFWIDEIGFIKEDLVTAGRSDEIQHKGYFLFDNFDYSDLNLLGRKTNTYKKLPSVCTFERSEEEHAGDTGRSLRLDYNKEPMGWCGYYTLLNQIDGEYYDLRDYESVSFMVKGKTGTERFEIGMADKNWGIIGDSLKAGTIDDYLAGGLSTQWQEVLIPLEDFGLLDFSEMSSFVINFYEKGTGTIYIDNLKFNLKKKEEKDE